MAPARFELTAPGLAILCDSASFPIRTVFSAWWPEGGQAGEQKVSTLSGSGEVRRVEDRHRGLRVEAEQPKVSLPAQSLNSWIIGYYGFRWLRKPKGNLRSLVR
jgi:hypothetical protein